MLGLSNKEALSSRRGDCCSRARTTSEGGGVVGGSLEDCRNAIVFGETIRMEIQFTMEGIVNYVGKNVCRSVEFRALSCYFHTGVVASSIT